MGYTKLGEYLRILRIKNHEVLGDMASKLGTSSSFLSSVETGRRNPPKNWNESISQIYGLSESERRDLQEAIEESKTQYKISVGNADNSKRKAAMEFARSFDNMDDDTAEKILFLLNKKKSGD